MTGYLPPRPLRASARQQKGATLIIGLILLTLIAMAVSTAFMMSSTNLKAVGNMQSRDEALAAANDAIEAVISTQLKTVGTVFNAPVADQRLVDIDRDGVNDYTVNIDQPVCLESAQASAGSSEGSGTSLTLGSGYSSTVSYRTLWEIRATAADTRSGAKVVIRQGVRVTLTDAQKTAHCP